MRSGNDLRVLLATDERGASDALQRQLEFEGCRVDTVHTGGDVLSAPAGLYDLVIIDLELPDMDGLSVLSQFRTGRNAATAVVLIKGEGEPDHIVQRGLDFGTAATWRLYPRCALGDSVAREKYLLDLSC